MLINIVVYTYTCIYIQQSQLTFRIPWTNKYDKKIDENKNIAHPTIATAPRIHTGSNNVYTINGTTVIRTIVNIEKYIIRV